MRCNRKQLAEIFAYDVKTIDRMVADGMPYLTRPGQEPGVREWQFDSAAVWRWLIGDTQDQMKEADLRIARAKATLTEIQVAEQMGVLVPIDDVVERVIGALAIVKSRLVAIPGRLAHLIAAETDPEKVHTLLKAEFDDALKQLDRHWTELG